MSFLTLDLSSANTGWAKFSESGALLEKGRITPDPKIDPYNKIHFVTIKVKELFKNVDELIIEDIFLGSFSGKFNVTTLKYLARLSGAILYEWIVQKYKIPHFYMAVSARPLAGCKGNHHKAEIQLYVCQKYKFALKKELKKIEEKILKLREDYKKKKIKKGKFKYQMNKISKDIDKLTGIGEDQGDAIILGLAYYNDKLKEK